MQDNNSTNVHFAARLDSLCSAKGLRNTDLAKAARCTPTAISNYRQGRIPKAEELLRIAQVTGVTMEWLLTGHSAGSNPHSDGIIAERLRVAEAKLDAVRSSLTGLLKKI